MAAEPQAPQIVRVFVPPANTAAYPINSHVPISGPQHIIYVQPQPQIVVQVVPQPQIVHVVVSAPTPVLQNVNSWSSMGAAQPTATATQSEPAADAVKADGESKRSKNAVSRCFHRVMDLDSLRPLIETEFRLKSVWSKGLLLRAIITTFILSLVDVVTDLAVIIKFTLPDNCLRKTYEADNMPSTYQAIVVSLAVSCGGALLNTILFKYVYAAKAMVKHKLSLWQAIKYVALVTYLKTSMSYSAWCNRYHWLRVLVTLLEDVIQVVVGFMIIEALRVPDAITQWSLFISLCAISYILAGTCVWPCVNFDGDDRHKNPMCSRPVRVLGRGCCCTCCLCGLWIGLLAGGMAEWVLGGSGSSDFNRGFQVADIEYSIRNVSVYSSDPEWAHFATGYRSNLSLNPTHYGIRDVSSLTQSQCIDANEFRLNAYDLEHATYKAIVTAPVICVSVVGRKLRAEVVTNVDMFTNISTKYAVHSYGSLILWSKGELNLQSDVKNVLQFPESLGVEDRDTYIIDEFSWVIDEFVIEYTWAYLLNC